ncbi:MAG: MFS transporter [Desulfobacterales bacterium]|nr:MFS transporter [Desulfobacterales bacterium]
MKSLSKEEKSWILYDVGSSTFVLIMVTSLMPIFFKETASFGVPQHISTANWGFANSFASIILAILSPIMGTIADVKGYKKRFLGFFTGLGIVATLAMLSIGKGMWLACIVIFVVARIGYSGANIFYDAFLVDVTDKDRMNWISASGYAWGYIGSVIPFCMVIGVIFWSISSQPGESLPIIAARVSFVIVAIFWFMFSIPVMLTIQQRFFIEKPKRLIQDSFIRLYKTFKNIRSYKPVFLFLLAYFFYIDGVDTIITMAMAYGSESGLKMNTMILAILFIQIIAFPFALLYAKLADRFSDKTMLYFGISVYGFITTLGFFLPYISDQSSKVILFWILSFLIASSQGGIQALSRSFFGKLIPEQHSTEFFGFYNIFGKFATIVGPLLMGIIGKTTGHSNYGILSIIILFVIGALLLHQVKPE